MNPTGSADTQTVKAENGTSSRPANAPEAPVKRGRGRPPKNGIAPQPKKVPTGRPRGRPPGSGSGVKKATAKKPTASTGTGRRGRPPKAKNATAIENATSTKNATTAETSTSGSSNHAKGAATAAHKSRKNATPDEPDAENEDADAEADATADAEYSMDDGAADPAIPQALNYGLEG